MWKSFLISLWLSVYNYWSAISRIILTARVNPNVRHKQSFHLSELHFPQWDEVYITELRTKTQRGGARSVHSDNQRQSWRNLIETSRNQRKSSVVGPRPRRGNVCQRDKSWGQTSRPRLITHRPGGNTQTHTYTPMHLGVGGVKPSTWRALRWGEVYISPRYHRVPGSVDFSLFLYLSHSRMTVESTDYRHQRGTREERKKSVCNISTGAYLWFIIRARSASQKETDPGRSEETLWCLH